MTDFVQIHFLTAYPASCLVRDDTGRPKTMTFGSAPRGRISSAALKRAVRTSDEFQNALEGRVGRRTQMLGTRIAQALEDEGFDAATATATARTVAAEFGKIKDPKGKDATEIEQLAFLAPEEAEAAHVLARRLAHGEVTEADAKGDLKGLIQGAVKAADIALFGRMFADRPEMRLDAAAEVAHPFTVERAETEIDYYVAVDDLNDRQEDAGSAFIGEQGFLTGLFYGYANVNKDLLTKNLDGDRDLADRTLAAFIEGLAKVAPVGKRASFGTRARANYLRVERGAASPRSLAVAFLSPIQSRGAAGGKTLLDRAVAELEATAEGFDDVYGDAPEVRSLNVATREGTLSDVIALSQGAPRTPGKV